MYDAGTVTKNGVDVPVRVDDDGTWYASVGDDNLRANTKPDLVKLIDKATKKVTQTLNIPFTLVELSTNFRTTQVKRIVRQGRATGLHSGNGNVLVKWADGSSAQLDRWSGRESTKFVPLTKDDVDTYTALYEASVKASEAVRKWEEEHRVDLRQAVTEALAKATEGASHD